MFIKSLKANCERRLEDEGIETSTVTPLFANNEEVLTGSKRYIGFTLAETLITLAIIGIVAAIAIPSLFANFNKKSYVTAWKKEFAVFNEAFNKVYYENGGSLENTCTFAEYSNNLHAASNCLLEKVLSHMNTMRKCKYGGTNEQVLCYHEFFTLLNGTAATSSTTFAGFILADGANGYLYFYPTDSGTTPHGAIYIDVNGNKSPNIVGKDIFRIRIEMTKLTPWSNYGSYLCCTDPNNSNCTGWGCGESFLIEEDFSPKSTYP